MRGQDTHGVVALRGGRAVGYLLASLSAPPRVSYRHVTVSYAGAAVDLAQERVDGREVYREMYAAVALQWVDAGCLAHYVSTPAKDRVAVDAWLSLGFGQHTALAVRATDLVRSEARPTDVEVRRATPADIDAVVRLEDGLRRYQAGPPTFIPYAPERRTGM